MRAVNLSSSAISRISYDEDARQLRIWFRESGMYVYSDIPPETYREFETASSGGRFFCEQIRGRFPCQFDPARKRFRPVEEPGTLCGGSPFLRRRRKAMADNKSSQDGRDRSRVAGDQPYEVQYFAEKHGISIEKARELIERHGNDREALDKAAERLTA